MIVSKDKGKKHQNAASINELTVDLADVLMKLVVCSPQATISIAAQQSQQEFDVEESVMVAWNNANDDSVEENSVEERKLFPFLSKVEKFSSPPKALPGLNRSQEFSISLHAWIRHYMTFLRSLFKCTATTW